MKILLFGKNGQVGRELQRSLAPLGELAALDYGNADLCGDLTNLKGLAATVQTVRPALIVNAAAYTAVDKAETESTLAHRINAEAPGVLAHAAQQCGATLVHYSTDYVFDGSGQTPWTEQDEPSPLNTYGRTKLAGEQAVASLCQRHLILRTSWVCSTHGGNFVRTVLQLGQEREVLHVVNDQHGAPTSAELLADATAHAVQQLLASRENYGLFHIAPTGETSWYAYARHVLDFAARADYPMKLAPDALHPIASSAYPLPARRPLNSRLNSSKFQATFDFKLPAWQAGVDRVLAEMLQSQKNSP